jgi:DNA-binding transcriptional MerR regulator
MTFISIGKAAELLGIDNRTLIRWEKSGRLLPDHYTPTGHRRYRLTDIEREQKMASESVGVVMAARVLGVSQQQVYNLESKGRLHPIKKDGKRRYLLSEIERTMEQEHKPTDVRFIMPCVIVSKHLLGEPEILKAMLMRQAERYIDRFISATNE